VAEATYRTSIDGADKRGLVTASVEWEAATECRPRPEGGPRGSPEWLHRPISPTVSPAAQRIPQNTDPLVFGGPFFSTFCRQRSGSSRRGLLELEPGSVIAFGSRPNYRWVCDTVLVVEKTVQHRRDDYPQLLDHAPGLAFLLTLEPVYAWPDAHGPSNAIFGATPDDPVDGMFSFVPCRLADDALRGFVRPAVEDHPAINANNTRAVSQNKELSVSKFPTLWRQLAHTVLDSAVWTSPSAPDCSARASASSCVAHVKSDGTVATRRSGCRCHTASEGRVHALNEEA
jgi:hypothetical protein